jgi:hypothetical protein
MIAHHDRSVCKQVIAIFAEGGLSAGGRYGVTGSTVIQFQQHHSSIHDSRVVQEWLSRQADVELIDWPPQVPDMNPIKNM